MAVALLVILPTMGSICVFERAQLNKKKFQIASVYKKKTKKNLLLVLFFFLCVLVV